MNVMIFDVPAESGGALSVLQDVYKEVIAHKDKKIKWFFVVSKPDLRETENVKVLRFPWIKKSWGHRYFFDNIIAPKVVKNNKIDLVFSLQNVTIPRLKCKQILYVHQSLPFVEYRYSFNENRLLWVYQNIIGNKIIKSIQKADHVIVQTEWMKEACIKRANVIKEKVEVVSPKVNIKVGKYFEPTKEALSTFFYPASEMEYKNHKLIIEASSKLKGKSVGDYEIILTLNGNENDYISSLYERVKEEKLPIRFRGYMKREEVFEMYTKSVLIFPSFIETFGLPLLESRRHQGIIFSSNTPFANEILNSYENAYFFCHEDHTELVKLMTRVLNSEIIYKKSADLIGNEEKNNKQVINILLNK